VRKAIAVAVICLSIGVSFSGGTSVAQTPQSGGTLRVGVYEFGYTSGFDPTGEYLGIAWSEYTNLLLRTLLTYRHVAGPAGTEVVPDLATEVPEPTNDGLRYEFHLKPGVMFGPPVNRPITSRDIKYAFARIKCQFCNALYPEYYTRSIRGMTPLTRRPEPSTITGIRTPNDSTIVFHLKRPVPDFPMRVTMAATAPIPREIARCFVHAGEYGRFVISSGPYMIEGSEDLDPTSCDTMKPISGFNPTRHLKFVRNPNYDPATDSPEVRENFLDRVNIRVFTSSEDLTSLVEDGTIDVALDSPTPDTIRRYTSDPDQPATMHHDPADRTWYVTMNLTRPPFDDVHVRKAVNLVVNKQRLRRAWGGPGSGEIATHVLPPNLTGGHPTGSEYDPYATPDHRGDVDAARAQMKLSRYDSNGDGLCDSSRCNDVMLVGANVPPHLAMNETLKDNLARIGIQLHIREVTDAYSPIMTVRRGVPISTRPGWGKNFPDPSTFIPPLFKGKHIICEGNYNYSMVGATPETKEACGGRGNYSDLPSVDADMRRCQTLYEPERRQCWIELDEKLMEEVVPWVPYLWQDKVRIVGPRVTKYEFDQFSAEMAFSHMAVEN
jgi:peptide/nickel transport system substrate-binding protein